jgi:hypothetical protein
MSGKSPGGNKSPDIYYGTGHRRFLGSRAMEHMSMKGYEAQAASFEEALRAT